MGADTAQVVIRPPIAWLLAVLVGLALDWLMPLPFMPAALPAGWIGGAVFAVALALFAWAIATITRAGSTCRLSKRYGASRRAMRRSYQNGRGCSAGKRRAALGRPLRGIIAAASASATTNV
jgi:hypothetical protein